MKILIQKCVCGGSEFFTGEQNGIDTARCSDCGVKHQMVPMDEAELQGYYERYNKDVYKHSFSHDYGVAELRLNSYAIKTGEKVLDLGCGSGAFISACLKRNIVAWGVDVAEGAGFFKFFYQGSIETHNFPTDYFDVVTIHDSLEHMVDPLGALEEVFRVLKQGGRLILDFPDYYGAVGAHHWKKIEHIWLFRERQLKELLVKVGFDLRSTKKPIPSKILLEVSKPEQKRVSILVPPGIGDSYWSYVKLNSFLQSKNLGIPDIYISDPDGRQRAIGLAERVPFLHAKDYKRHSFRISQMQEAYLRDGQSIFEGVVGCDYFIAFNGQMRFGKSMDQIHPELENQWYLPLFKPKTESVYAQQFLSRNGPYNLAYFVPHGMYKKWLLLFPPEQILDTLLKIQRVDKKPFVFLGSKWDEQTSIYSYLQGSKKLNFIDMVGKTSFEELMALTRKASGIIGFPAGNTIMGTVLKRPTTLIWCDYFHKGFWANSCPPDSLNNWYRIEDAKNLSSDRLSKTFLENSHA